MSASELPTGELNGNLTARLAPLLPTLTAAIFLSAALLFAVQPMFTKMVLPRLGGSPQVWSVAMVFFQAALLAGYAYAHLLTRFAPLRWSIAVHVAAMVAACLTLPPAIAAGWGKPPAAGEAFWLIALFAASIGLPFFALAANGPLLQAWFARTAHPAAKDPYFLYAASNIGSFLALAAYPLAIEPLLPLGGQTLSWSIGFAVLIMLIAACGALSWRADGQPAQRETADPAATAAPTWRNVATWVALAAVPSGLLVAVTAHISTDIAVVPLLWVVPLALYLLTFVIAFSRRRLISHSAIVLVQAPLVFALVVQALFYPYADLLAVVALHILVFFVCALMCHGELARRRPPPAHLTSFYMWLSFGGMIGGLLTALVAPYVFNWVTEYPLLIGLAVLCRWLMPQPATFSERVVRYGLLAAALLIVVFWNIYFGVPLAVAALLLRVPLVPAAVIAGLLMQAHVRDEWRGNAIFVRSFFGVHRITESRGQFRVLSHGLTIHGVQRIRDAAGRPDVGRPEPLAYYFYGSPFGQVINAVRARAGGPIRYAVVGLGTGALACHAWPNDMVAFYEIDPVVVRIARDSGLFGFIEACGTNASIVLGDARLTLADAPDESYDLIIIDAFSADAIPVHLLTREAIAIYLRKLRPHGVLQMHLSNRNLELASVATGAADANGLVVRVHESSHLSDEATQRLGGTNAVAARSNEDFGTLAESEDWVLQEADPDQRVWTDDYSNIVAALLRKLRELEQ